MDKFTHIEIELGWTVVDFFFYEKYSVLICYQPTKMFSIITDGDKSYEKRELILNSENAGEARDILTKAAKEQILYK